MMKTLYPFLVGLLVGFVALFGYVFGFWFLFAGYPYGLALFYGALFGVPVYVVFALLAPMLFRIKNRALRRNWRLSVLMVPVGAVMLWIFVNVFG